MLLDFDNEYAGAWLVQTTRFWGGRKIRLSCAQWPKPIEDVLGCICTKKPAHPKNSKNGIITHVAEISLKSGSAMQFEFHYLTSDKNSIKLGLHGVQDVSCIMQYSILTLAKISQNYTY